MEKAVREIKEFGSVQVTLRAQWGPSKGSDFKTSCAMMTSTGGRYFDNFKANLMSQDSQQECEFCDWCQRQWEKQHHAGSRPRTLCREQANEALLPYSGLCSKGESSSGDTDHPEKWRWRCIQARSLWQGHHIQENDHRQGGFRCVSAGGELSHKEKAATSKRGGEENPERFQHQRRQPYRHSPARSGQGAAANGVPWETLSLFCGKYFSFSNFCLHLGTITSETTCAHAMFSKFFPRPRFLQLVDSVAVIQLWHIFSSLGTFTHHLCVVNQDVSSNFFF